MTSQPARMQLADHLRQQDTDILVFGAGLAARAYDDLLSGNHNLSDEAANEAHSLRQKVTGLVQSTDTDDIVSIQRINDHFSAHELPALREYAPSALGNLPDHDVVRWLASASHRDIAIFSLWHYQYQKALQKRLIEIQPILHEDILTNAKCLVDLDIFPIKALGLYQKSCRADRDIQPIDAFYYGCDNVAAYQNDRVIGLSSPFQDPYFQKFDISFARHIMFHEMTHDVGMQDNKWNSDNRGFQRGITEPFAYHRATEEFFVEHVTTVGISHESPEIIDPDERVNDTYIYGLERKLHSLISHDSIPVDLWGHAYIESRNSLRGMRLRRDLARRLGRAFGSWQHYLNFSRIDNTVPDGIQRNTYLNNTIDSITQLNGQLLLT